MIVEYSGISFIYLLSIFLFFMDMDLCGLKQID